MEKEEKKKEGGEEGRKGWKEGWAERGGKEKERKKKKRKETPFRGQRTKWWGRGVDGSRGLLGDEGVLNLDGGHGNTSADICQDWETIHLKVCILLYVQYPFRKLTAKIQILVEPDL
jgi:hypothetical protein